MTQTQAIQATENMPKGINEKVVQITWDKQPHGLSEYVVKAHTQDTKTEQYLRIIRLGEVHKDHVGNWVFEGKALPLEQDKPGLFKVAMPKGQLHAFKKAIRTFYGVNVWLHINE